MVARARDFGVLCIGCMLAACEGDSKNASAAPVESARPPAAVVVLAGRPKRGRLPARVAPLAETTVVLVAKDAPDSKLRVGASKIGGVPDLPPTAVWPKVSGRPLAFLAQLDLNDVRRDLDWGLPHEGMLWFFYDAAQQPDGYSPADRHSFRVLYSSGNLHRLGRAMPPPGLELPPFNERSLIFKADDSYPELESYMVRKLGLGTGEVEDYREFLAKLAASRQAPDHRLLGHPVGAQSDVQSSSQFASNGLDLSEGIDEDDSRARALEPGSGDWQLLLKLDSDEKAGMDWGEGGRLYFMIRGQDLRDKNFDAVWLILDSD